MNNLTKIATFLFVISLVAGIFTSCVTIEEQNPAVGGGSSLVAIRISVSGSYAAGRVGFSSKTKPAFGLKAAVVNDSIAEVTLLRVETGEEIEADNLVGSYSVFHNIPRGTFKVLSAVINEDFELNLESVDLRFSIEEDNVHYFGAYRVEFSQQRIISSEKLTGSSLFADFSNLKSTLGRSYARYGIGFDDMVIHESL